MGTVTIGGRTLEQTLQRAINNPRYDLDRERVPDGMVTPGEWHRKQMLAPIIAAFKQASRAELFGRHPKLEEAWRSYEIFKDRAGAGMAQPGERENLLLKF